MAAVEMCLTNATWPLSQRFKNSHHWSNLKHMTDFYSKCEVLDYIWEIQKKTCLSQWFPVVPAVAGTTVKAHSPTPQESELCINTALGHLKKIQ